MSGQLQPPTPAPTLLTTAQAAALLDQVIYEQLLECIDLDALHHVAQSLDTSIGELGIVEERDFDLARSIIDRALQRLPGDLSGYLRVSDYAARDGCLLCRAEAHHAGRGSTATAAGDDRRPKRPRS